MPIIAQDNFPWAARTRDVDVTVFTGVAGFTTTTRPSGTATNLLTL